MGEENEVKIIDGLNKDFILEIKSTTKVHSRTRKNKEREK